MTKRKEYHVEYHKGWGVRVPSTNRWITESEWLKEDAIDAAVARARHPSNRPSSVILHDRKGRVQPTLAPMNYD